MSVTNIMDSEVQMVPEKPGAQLAAQRILRDYSQEYVAGKLHLRVRIIELLEADDYENMPEPVFIKGYLRAYAKLLGVPAEPLLNTFNLLYSDERKTEKTLWQSRRQSNRAEHVVRWVTILFSLGVLVAVGIWWESNRENEHLLPTKIEAKNSDTANTSEQNIRLTDLSKMRSLLSSTNTSSAGEAE
ncbi:MAG TPA: helix-turn-helix domain-containing protein [Legionellaceae bacterium]|nr:helix-turn-helix domain-containing protein [Legionellaceae bacterium]